MEFGVNFESFEQLYIRFVTRKPYHYVGRKAFDYVVLAVWEKYLEQGGKYRFIFPVTSRRVNSLVSSQVKVKWPKLRKVRKCSQMVPTLVFPQLLYNIELLKDLYFTLLSWHRYPHTCNFWLLTTKQGFTAEVGSSFRSISKNEVRTGRWAVSIARDLVVWELDIPQVETSGRAGHRYWKEVAVKNRREILFGSQ